MRRSLGLLAVIACLTMPVLAQDAPLPTVKPAVSGLLDAFKTHPLVGLGEIHGLAQELDFYAALVRDPRFADEVGNLVLEFANASHQDTLDRYLAGENIAYHELRKVWTETASWTPTGSYIGLINLLSEVRAVNAGLPPQKRIRIWAGEPPTDWSRIQTNAEWLAIIRTRTPHAVSVIEREILGKGKKALIIYGRLHFVSSCEPLKCQRQILDEKHPGALFLVLPYAGFIEKACAVRLEGNFRGWPVPAFATVRGTSLEKALQPEGCHAEPGRTPNVGNTPEDIKRFKIENDINTGAGGHALLYLGPASSLTLSQKSPDIYMDDAFRDEMSRRYQIITGRPLTSSTAKDNPVSPRPLRP